MELAQAGVRGKQIPRILLDVVRGKTIPPATVPGGGLLDGIAASFGERGQVDASHAAALAAGASDYGAPGVREIYHPHYYGGFVIDPDGNNTEAVCPPPRLRRGLYLLYLVALAMESGCEWVTS